MRENEREYYNCIFSFSLLASGHKFLSLEIFSFSSLKEMFDFSSTLNRMFIILLFFFFILQNYFVFLVVDFV